MSSEKSELEGSPRRWWVLGMLVLSLLVVQMDTTILGVAVQRLPRPVPEGLGLSQGTLQWAINSYTLVMAGLMLTTGALADGLGNKRVLLSGMILLAVASAWCAFSTAGSMLIAGRTVLGVAAALVTPATLSIISHTFNDLERPKAIGIWSGGIGIAVATGPIVGGLLLDHLWWGSIFLVNIPVVAVAVVAMMLIVPESRNPQVGRFDVPGLLLSRLGMVVLVGGILEGGDTGQWASPRVWSVVLAGVIVLAGFVLWQRRAESPLLPISWFGSREFSGSIAVMSLAFFAMMGVTFAVAFYLLSLRQLSVLTTGLLMLPLALAQLVLSAHTPSLAQSFGARATGAFGMLGLMVAFMLFAILGAGSPLWIVEIALFLIGVGIAFIMPSASAAVMASVPKERSASASATSNAFRQVGGALGNAILGSILAAVYRTEVTDHLDVLPGAVRTAASGSLQATQAALDTTELQASEAASIVEASQNAFVAGFHASALIGATVAFLGVLLAATTLAPRDHEETSAEPNDVD